MKRKKYKYLNELKANNSTDKIRYDILDIIKKYECEIYTIILNKSTLNNDLKDKKTKVYNYLTNLILAECDLNGKNVHFIIDKRVKKKIVREDFNNYIINRHQDVKFTISHFDSCNSNGLQLVDFASWSIFRYYEYEDEKFLNYLTEKITHKKVLFSQK